jgi:hypothetical protein
MAAGRRRIGCSVLARMGGFSFIAHLAAARSEEMG